MTSSTPNRKTMLPICFLRRFPSSQRTMKNDSVQIPGRRFPSSQRTMKNGSVQMPGRPAKEKINGKTCFAIWCVLFQLTHTLWARTWHTMLWKGFGLKPWTSTLQHLALDIHPSAFINFIKAKAGEGSSVASSPEIGLLEPEHRGAGT